MELYSFLISCIFVNVSTYDIEDYIKEVCITNAHIELAYNTNNLIINDKFVLNGLEHVIKTIVKQRLHSLGTMNNMFAVPEFRLYDGWNELIGYQVALQEEIQSELNIPVPQVPEENIPVPEINLFGKFKEVLVDLGEKRREFTGIALKNILNRTINFGQLERVTNLLDDRRLHSVDDFENRISHALAGPEEELSLSWMCHLIAFYMCTKSPITYTTDIRFNTNGTCTLSDGITSETYGKIEGQWCQVIGNEVRPLKDLL